MLVTLEKVLDITSGIKSFHFQPEHPIRYTAGQFIELTIPHNPSDSRGVKRWFTLSSSPTEDYLSITTKFIGNPLGEGNSSFKKALLCLPAGTQISMSSPMGDFVLPKDAAKPMVFVAGGIGVTPMRSMIKYLVDTKQKRDIHLIYAANKPEEVAFEDLFNSADIIFTKVIKDPTASWQGEVGSLNGSRIVEMAGGTDKTYFVSGPEPMVEALEKQLKELGIKNIQGDFFPNYTNPN